MPDRIHHEEQYDKEDKTIKPRFDQPQEPTKNEQH